MTQQYAKELAQQTPIRSWTELEQTYDPIVLDRIDETNNRENITLSGLIIDDVVKSFVTGQQIHLSSLSQWIVI